MGLDGLFENPEAVTEHDLHQLTVERVTETDRLDFKRCTYRQASEHTNATDEFAKDVAALANHRGGLLLIGVVEKKLAGQVVAAALKPITEVAAQGEDKWVLLDRRGAREP